MWLCIDQGGASSRAVVFGRHGDVVAQHACPVETRRQGEVRVEHDPGQLLHSVRSALEGVAEELGEAVGRIRAAGIATQRSSLVCADSGTGRPLSPIISWQDRRGGADLDAFADCEALIQEITGLKLSPHYGVAKIRWCQAHLGEVSAALAASRLVAAPLVSFLLRNLLQPAAWRVDPANASRTLLMDHRSLSWSPALLSLFEIDVRMLPEITPCRFPYGDLILAGHRVPLEVSTGDQSAAVFCEGAPQPGTAFVNVGTGAFIQCVIGSAPVRDPALLTSVVWQDEERTLYVLEGTVNGAGSALDAMRRSLGFEQRPEPAQLESWLAEMTHAPLFLNGVSGLGSPDWVADFPTRFIGEGGPEAKLASVYESIVFLLMRNLERMRARIEVTRVVITGGVARVDWLAQALSSLSGLPVRRPR